MRNRRLHLVRASVCALLAFLLSASASDIIPAPPQARPIAIKGATIHPVSGPDIPAGTIIFADGKIVAVGADAAVPAEAEVIDGTGKHVYPGFINAHSVLGLTEISAARATLDLEEVGPINPNARSVSSVNPDTELLPVTRENGILTSLIVPEGGLISGQSSVLRLDGWTPEEMAIRTPAAMHLRWPNLAINRDPRAPKSVEDQRKEIEKLEKQIREAFRLARAYAQAKKAPPPGFQTDLRWEAMIPVVEGTLPLFLHADSVAQIEAALAFGREMGMKFTLVGGREAWRMARELKASDTPVIVGLTTAMPARRGAAYESAFANPARLREAGVRFCIATSGSGSEGAHERNLPYEAGFAAAFGLPKEEALKSVTLYPAQLLGVAERLGSLEPGKAATLFIANGDPLDFPTQIEAAFIDGRKIDLTSRQTRLRDKYRQKYQRREGG